MISYQKNLKLSTNIEIKKVSVKYLRPRNKQ